MNILPSPLSRSQTTFLSWAISRLSQSSSSVLSSKGSKLNLSMREGKKNPEGCISSQNSLLERNRSRCYNTKNITHQIKKNTLITVAVKLAIKSFFISRYMPFKSSTTLPTVLVKLSWMKIKLFLRVVFLFFYLPFFFFINFLFTFTLFLSFFQQKTEEEKIVFIFSKR